MEYKHILNLALCVCAQDGVISETELRVLFEKLNEITKVSKKDFELGIEDFFDNKLGLEEYLEAASELGINQQILDLCLEAASSDGLNIKENIAFQKAKNFWAS